MKIKRFFECVLMAIGLLAILGVGYSCYKVYSYKYPQNIENKNDVDVRFVMNWCNLGDKNIIKVLNAYKSERSFTGDHIDAYEIQIKPMKYDLLPSADLNGGWFNCDTKNEFVSKVLDFSISWTDDNKNTPWFPKSDLIKSDKFKIYIWSSYFYGLKPSASEIILLDTVNDKVYYIGCKT